MMRDDPNWRDIPGYGGIYQINSMGEVRSWKHGKWGGFAPVPKMLTPYTTKHKPQGSCRRWLLVKLTDAYED